MLDIGIKPGPIYKRFKEDEMVNLSDGKVLFARDFIKETIYIKKICYCGDTSFDDNSIKLSVGADLLIHEATFSSNNREKAFESFHSTIEDAVKVAKLAEVKKLVLTHISSRYENTIEDVSSFTEELKKHFLKDDTLEIIPAYDLMELSI